LTAPDMRRSACCKTKSRISGQLFLVHC